MDRDRAWSALNLQTEPEVQALFDASVFVRVGNGERTLFWKDAWLDRKSIQAVAPTLWAMVSWRTIHSRTVAQALQDRRWIDDINGALSVQVLVEYLQLWSRLSDIHLEENAVDVFVWRWSPDGVYSARSAYDILHCGAVVFQGAERIWRTWAPLKIKIFIWLASRRRIWTADRRLRHGLDARPKCWLCDQESETADHILVTCSFSKSVWWETFAWARRNCSFIVDVSLQDWWAHIVALQAPALRKGTSSLFMLVAWHLWKERNARLFEHRSTTVSDLLRRIVEDAKLWYSAGARHLGCLFHE